MQRGWRLVRMLVSSLRLWPHLLLLAVHRNRETVHVDVRCWAGIIFADDADAPGRASPRSCG